MTLEDAHKLGHKGLEVEYDFLKEISAYNTNGQVHLRCRA
jgi:hypothetical protein